MVDRSKADEQTANLTQKIQAAYNTRQKPQRDTTDAQECDMLRKKFTGAANAVTQTLTAIRNEIKIMTDPGDIIEILKEGYLNALENMCSTLDYSNNIQIMSRMTKKLAAQQNKYKEKKNGKVDIFEGVEKLSTEFISRLRKFEFEQIQDQQKIMEVTTDQEAIQEAILKELSSYEEKNKANELKMLCTC